MKLTKKQSEVVLNYLDHLYVTLQKEDRIGRHHVNTDEGKIYLKTILTTMAETVQDQE